MLIIREHKVLQFIGTYFQACSDQQCQVDLHNEKSEFTYGLFLFALNVFVDEHAVLEGVFQ